LNRPLEIAEKVRSIYDKGSRGERLDCLCAVVTAELSLALRDAHIPHKIALANQDEGSHAFIVVDDTIVDLTAKQFNRRYKAVYTKPFTGKERSWYHKEPTFYNTAEELVRTQLLNFWPEYQVHRKLGKQVRADLIAEGHLPHGDAP